MSTVITPTEAAERAKALSRRALVARARAAEAAKIYCAAEAERVRLSDIVCAMLDAPLTQHPVDAARAARAAIDALNAARKAEREAEREARETAREADSLTTRAAAARGMADSLAALVRDAND